MEATENVAKQVGPIMNTFYGGMWELTEEIFTDYEDLAYKNGDLGLHTDGTYAIETPR